MAVGVERECDRGVPKTFVDHLGMDSLGQQKGRRRVPKVVEADLPKSSPGQKGLKGASLEVRATDWSSIDVSEDEALRVRSRAQRLTIPAT